MSKTTTDEIVSALTRSIVNRRLMPGAKLAEQQLADHFNVSRTIIRQALHQLSQKHLIRMEHSRGAFVSTPSVEESKQVFEVRRMLEIGMVQELAQRINLSDIEFLKNYLNSEAEAVSAHGDTLDRNEFLDGFHVLLAKILNNDALTQTLRELILRCALISLMYKPERAQQDPVNYHEAIINALINKDGRTASKLTQLHLEHVESSLVYTDDPIMS